MRRPEKGKSPCDSPKGSTGPLPLPGHHPITATQAHAAFLCPFMGSCIPGGRAAASLHWSALETEQERWCSPSGRRPAQAGLLAEWGAPGEGKGQTRRRSQGRGAHRLSWKQDCRHGLRNSNRKLTRN